MLEKEKIKQEQKFREETDQGQNERREMRETYGLAVGAELLMIVGNHLSLKIENF